MQDDFSHWLLFELHRASQQAKKGKLATVDEFKYEMFPTEALLELRNEIEACTYKPQRSIAFINHNPKDREIFAASFIDRIVHHFVINQIGDWWDRRLMPFSYSCRKGRGTDFGVRDAYAKMRRASDNFHKKTYVIQLDINSYFCSIPRKLLLTRVQWGLDKQFAEKEDEATRKLYQILKHLVREIIMDDPVKGVTIKGSKKEWLNYPKHKSLLMQKPGVGIVIGNLTSQVFSNAFLDDLDRFLFFGLGLKEVGRYVDDVFIMVREDEMDEFFEDKMPKIRTKLTEMGMSLNEGKTKCQDIRNGWEFIGAYMRPYMVLPSKRLVRNFREAVPLVVAGEKSLDVMISYLGRLQHFDSQNLIEEVFNENGLDYVKDPVLGPNSLYYTDPKEYNKRIFWD